MSNKEATKRYREKYPERRKETTARYRELNKEKIKEYSHIYYELTNDKQKMYQVEYAKRNPEKKLRQHLRRNYNLSLEEYNEKVKNQSNLCKICGNLEKENHRLSVDHCHATGRVRGLLCKNCNKALGLFKDSILLLENATNYLKENGG